MLTGEQHTNFFNEIKKHKQKLVILWLAKVLICVVLLSFSTYFLHANIYNLVLWYTIITCKFYNWNKVFIDICYTPACSDTQLVSHADAHGISFVVRSRVYCACNLKLWQFQTTYTDYLARCNVTASQNISIWCCWPLH